VPTEIIATAAKAARTQSGWLTKRGMRLSDRGSGLSLTSAALDATSRAATAERWCRSRPLLTSRSSGVTLSRRACYGWLVVRRLARLRAGAFNLIPQHEPRHRGEDPFHNVAMNKERFLADLKKRDVGVNVKVDANVAFEEALRSAEKQADALDPTLVKLWQMGKLEPVPVRLRNLGTESLPENARKLRWVIELLIGLRAAAGVIELPNAVTTLRLEMFGQSFVWDVRRLDWRGASAGAFEGAKQGAWAEHGLRPCSAQPCPNVAAGRSCRADGERSCVCERHVFEHRAIWLDDHDRNAFT
jgi:hypothetical protein